MTAQELNHPLSSLAARPTLPQRVVALYRSERFRHAVRVGLAMVVAYYISLAMGWHRPHWAGLAVAMCSLQTVGDSLNKGLLRILGTFMAGAAVILFAAMFPQDRWHYLMAATLYMAFCSYMTGSTSRWYFWVISGAVMAVLALAGGAEGAPLFETIILRIQQTTMGMIVYLVVSIVVWPNQATPVLHRTTARLLRTQRKLMRDYFAQLASAPGDTEARKLRAQAAAAANALPAITDGAELASFNVWEVRRLWRRCVANLGDLNQATERWRHGFAELQKLDLKRLAPGFGPAGDEIERRLLTIERMILGRPPASLPDAIDLTVDQDALEAVSPFDRAAVLLSCDRLRRIDRLTKEILDMVASIRDFGPPASEQPTTAGIRVPWTIDSDRLAGAVRTFTALWAILLAAIYIPDLPMPVGVVPITGSAIMTLSMMPYVPLVPVAVAGIASIAFAGAFHILVMPHLDGFAGLGAGIFLVVFLLMFVLAKPAFAIARSIGMAVFVVIISVKIEQTYSFLVVVNFAIGLLIALTALWLSGLLPITFRPQPLLFHRLTRFFTSCSRLTESLRTAGTDFTLTRPLAFYAHEARRLPDTIRPWIASQPAVAEGRVPRERLDNLVDTLNLLSARLHDLLKLREGRQAAVLRSEYGADIRAWRIAIQNILNALAADPSTVDPAVLRSRLDAELKMLESRIEATLNSLPADALSTEELLNMYRLLGAYRGLSEALILVVDSAARIDWNEMREERF